MRKLQLSLRNCHGIREMDATLPFERLKNNLTEPRRAVAIYAPNGKMKSSFARSFLDYSRGQDSSDPNLTFSQSGLPGEDLNPPVDPATYTTSQPGTMISNRNYAG